MTVFCNYHFTNRPTPRVCVCVLSAKTTLRWSGPKGFTWRTKKHTACQPWQLRRWNCANRITTHWLATNKTQSRASQCGNGVLPSLKTFQTFSVTCLSELPDKKQPITSLYSNLWPSRQLRPELILGLSCHGNMQENTAYRSSKQNFDYHSLLRQEMRDDPSLKPFQT